MWEITGKICSFGLLMCHFQRRFPQFSAADRSIMAHLEQGIHSTISGNLFGRIRE
jgi:hypothetical protein